jgi:hypothetical protein
VQEEVQNTLERSTSLRNTLLVSISYAKKRTSDNKLLGTLIRQGLREGLPICLIVGTSRVCSSATGKVTYCTMCLHGIFPNTIDISASGVGPLFRCNLCANFYGVLKTTLYPI